MSKDKPESVGFNKWEPADFYISASGRTDYGRSIYIGLWGYVDGDLYAAEEIQLRRMGDSDSHFVPDAVELDPKQAEQLMNALWDAGIRPSEAKLKKLQVGALQNHLEDMRTLVFDHLLPVVKNTGQAVLHSHPSEKGISILKTEDTEQ